MKINNLFKLKLNIFNVLMIITILFIASYILLLSNESKRQKAMDYHCLNINKDFTRPYLRECVVPLYFKNQVFTFKTKGGDIEQYTIISVSNSEDNIYNDTFYYNFNKTI